MNEDFILGALSLIIWTITLLTTVKYVLIAMRADNNGEGGIFSLYALVKKVAPWLIFPAMIGGAALLADGVLTPAVTVTTAVEGLRSIPAMNRFLGSGQAHVVLITLVIISTLFAVQWAGTSKIGKAFGPVMLVWFSFLGIMGLLHVFDRPGVLLAFNPVYAARILVSPYNKAGFMILGSVFLAATGAEALYSDMGHVGRGNIYASWPFVKACLILNYLGQGAWILTHTASGTLAAIPDMNPFFQMLPEALRAPAVALGALAAIIASQALITGSYTLVSEAIRLDFMPHLEVRYPSDTKGQIYIGAVNTVLYLGCAAVVLYFRTSARMEAAYGLAITVTMLMTTLLLAVYLWNIRKKQALAVGIALVFGAIGFLDDYEKLKKKQNLGLTAGKKILLQLAAAVAFIFLMRRFGYVALDSLYIPFWNTTVAISEPLYVIFAAFVIVGTVNSVNLTDGVDGLAASTTMPVCIFFAVLSILWGERFLSLGVFASGIAGGLLGFLIYNFNPAKVFMGDTGSLFLGGAVAALAFAYDMPLILVTVGIMYIVEALSDIIQVGYFKLTHGKRVFRMSPFHHHLEMGGWTGHKWKEKQIVALFAGVTVLFAVLSFIGVFHRFGA